MTYNQSYTFSYEIQVAVCSHSNKEITDHPLIPRSTVNQYLTVLSSPCGELSTVSTGYTTPENEETNNKTYMTILLLKVEFVVTMYNTQ